MENITLGGHSIEALKQIKKDIAKDACKVIADNMKEALAKFEELKVVESNEDAQAMAKVIHDHLETVQIVAGVSGCTFMLPYYEEYGRYDTEDIISSFIENDKNENLDFDYGNCDSSWVYKLYSLAEGMESDSRDWHSSRC